MKRVFTNRVNRLKTIICTVGIAALIVSCSPDQAKQSQPITIDGSSTVYPLTNVILEQFNATDKSDLEVKGSFSGTGGGFKKFCSGETDINNASRPILKDEMELCKQNKISYIELPIAFDALTVVVNPQNDWAKEITLAELKQIWEPAAQQKITQWNQVRPSWPSQPLLLFGPGADSGTFDYFTEAVMGQVGKTRSDYVASEDDEILAKGVKSNPNALGYFGYAYYVANQNELRAVAIDSGNGPTLPSRETVENAQYQPLARPLFIYVNAVSAQKNPLMNTFIDFYIRNAAAAIESLGYIPFAPDDYEKLYRNYHKAKIGTAFGGQSGFNLTIDEVLTKRTDY
ncbi:MAG: PstS family phosphate ABC transporter substrate-binding protein [Microcoleaceae cyanobacterium]